MVFVGGGFDAEGGIREGFPEGLLAGEGDGVGVVGEVGGVGGGWRLLPAGFVFLYVSDGGHVELSLGRLVELFALIEKQLYLRMNIY